MRAADGRGLLGCLAPPQTLERFNPFNFHTPQPYLIERRRDILSVRDAARQLPVRFARSLFLSFE